MSLLEVKNISVRFGGLVALNDVSFAVDEGTIFACIGPNGAGKSTIYNCINGFVRPERGEIRLGGMELTRLAPDFIEHGRKRVSRYVKVDSLIDRIFEGLQKAGLDGIS